MKWIVRCLGLGALLLSAGSPMAQQSNTGASGGDTNTTSSLAGVNRPGSPGGAGTSPLGSGPDTGATNGVANTTGSLAGVGTRRAPDAPK